MLKGAPTLAGGPMPVPDASATLQRLMGDSPAGLALVNLPCHLFWANPAFFKTTGESATRLGSDLREIPRLAGGPLVTACEQALHRGTSTALRNVSLSGQGGALPSDMVDLWVWPVPGRSEGQTHALVLVSGSEAWAQEHERSRLFYESFLTSPSAIEVTDKNGILIDVNPAFEKIYGYSRAECVGKKPNLVRSRQTPLSVFKAMWAALTDPALGHWSGEITNRDRHGHERPIFLTITAVRDDMGEVSHYIGTAVDLTEQRKWERGVARADRMASLGQLAAGVAHEINTPLANVMLVAESIKGRTEDPWLLARTETIEKQAEMAGRIVRGLLDFSRQGEMRVVDLDLNKVTHEAVEFLRGKLGSDVEFEEHYSPEPLPIQGDRGQLIQVLTNVLNNAYDAIEGSGRIVLRLRKDGDEAEVEIADSGPGIPPEVLPRIFEPFFTTKEEGRGTGLGLAISHGILQSHHGTIRAQNLMGQGASFIIRIPLRPPKRGATPASSA